MFRSTPPPPVDTHERIDGAGGDDARTDHGRLDRAEPLANPARMRRGRVLMRPLRLALTGVVAMALLGGLGGAVVAQDVPADPMAPVEVTGKFVDLTCGGSAGTRSGPRVEGGQTTCEVDNEWSDPRLEGTETYTSNEFRYLGGSGLTIGHYVHDIVNDDGAWRMRPQFRFESFGQGPENFSGTWVLDGEGAYEGLIAVLAKGSDDSDPVRGFIIEGDLPSAPEEGSTE